jgi:heptosyltransferase-2
VSRSEKYNSFLVIQTAFLGDAILSTSVVEKIHSRFPAAGIDLLVRKGNEGIFDNHPFLNEVIIWDKKNHKYRNLFMLLKQIRLTRYDAVINLQRFAASGFLTAFSGAVTTFGFSKNPFHLLFTHSEKHIIKKGVHEIDRNHTLISKITDHIPARPQLYPSENNFDNVKQYTDRDFLTISPASVWYTKTFPNYKWIELIQFLYAKTGCRIILLGSSSEFSFADIILKHANVGDAVNLCGKLSILESAALMKSAKMNYVNDSAPLHIASAMNAPVTAIYCSTVPEFGFSPLSDYSKVIQTDIPLDCKPCGLHGYKECPLIHFKCGRSIEISEKFLP